MNSEKGWHGEKRWDCPKGWTMFSYRCDICAQVGWLLAFWAGALNTYRITSHFTSDTSLHTGCGALLFLTLNCVDCGGEYKVSITCRDRTCPYCRERQWKRLMARYGLLFRGLNPKKLSFITLTTRLKPGAPLRPQVDRIRASIGKS